MGRRTLPGRPCRKHALHQVTVDLTVIRSSREKPPKQVLLLAVMGLKGGQKLAAPAAAYGRVEKGVLARWWSTHRITEKLCFSNGAGVYATSSQTNPREVTPVSACLSASTPFPCYTALFLSFTVSVRLWCQDDRKAFSQRESQAWDALLQ